MALNHWKLAIETHQTNFPDTLHDCTDISACDPRRYPSTDILITSPECTTHSPAGGNNHKALKKQMDLFDTGIIDPATERSRATMWDVCRFTEYHRYNIIIVENVVEAKTRWPLFDTWLTAMHVLGYNHKCVFLNSMHCHPTPQSRDRMYVVFWKKGNKAPDLEYRPSAHCLKCLKDVHAVQCWKDSRKNFGKYRQQYVYCCPSCSSVVEPYYYAAFNCIDWSDIGIRIGDRPTPLAPNTVKRIKYGLNKYGKQPLMVTTKYHSEPIENGSKPAGEPLRTQTSEQAHAVLNPFLVRVAYGSPRGVAKGIDDVLYTQATTPIQAIVSPFVVDDKQSTGINFRVRGVGNPVNTVHTDPRLRLITPFVCQLEHSQRLDNVKGVNESFQTQTARQSKMLVNPPYIVEMNRTGESKPSTEATATITAGGINYSLFCPPPFITMSHGESSTREITEPVNTVTTGGIHSGIVSNEAWNSFVSYYYGTAQASSIIDPLGTARCSDTYQMISYQEPKLEDCYYRMLKPHEIKLAMAFDPDYVVLGAGKWQVKQLGNAVTPPAMEWLIGQAIKSLS